MKKSFKVMLAVAMMFSATLSANAQFSSKSESRTPDRFHMGIRGGITSNMYSDYSLKSGYDHNTDALVFPTGGIALDFQIASVPLFLGLGVNYVNYGFKIDDGYYSYKDDECHSIQVPITVSYHIGVAPNFFINPFVGEFTAYNFDSPTDKDLNYGLRFGCGLNFGRLTFDVGYDLGLADLGNDAKTGTLFMTIGFNWAGSR